MPAFGHLAGIRVLDLAGCEQPTVTPAAFAALVWRHVVGSDRLQV